MRPDGSSSNSVSACSKQTEAKRTRTNVSECDGRQSRCADDQRCWNKGTKDTLTAFFAYEKEGRWFGDIKRPVKVSTTAPVNWASAHRPTLKANRSGYGKNGADEDRQKLDGDSKRKSAANVSSVPNDFQRGTGTMEQHNRFISSAIQFPRNANLAGPDHEAECRKIRDRGVEAGVWGTLTPYASITVRRRIRS